MSAHLFGKVAARLGEPEDAARCHCRMSFVKFALSVSLLFAAACESSSGGVLCEVTCPRGAHFVRIVATDARSAFCELDWRPHGPFVLEENAVRMTGTLASGKFADLVVFSPKTSPPRPASDAERDAAREYLDWRTSGLARFLELRHPAEACR